VASAQTYPTRPVRIIVGYPAGVVSDIFARLIGQWLSERLGQSFLVENRPGAGGTLAVDLVARAAPDGYTLLLSAVNDSYNEHLYPDIRFNYIRDISPVASIALVPLVMEVNPSFAAKTVPEFINYAKANPGKIGFASAGAGSAQHLCGELMKMMTGIDIFHVPYRGDAAAITDLLAGQVQVYFGNLPASIEYIKAGHLRALAVTSATRSAALPDTPAIGEFLPGLENNGWFGICAPKNTPAVIIEKLNHDINAALGDARIKARFADLGAAALSISTVEFCQAYRRGGREVGQSDSGSQYQALAGASATQTLLSTSQIAFTTIDSDALCPPVDTTSRPSASIAPWRGGSGATRQIGTSECISSASITGSTTPRRACSAITSGSRRCRRSG
jgi:tripartite-type tricarboxylate transporter receptor subunit TctC